MHRRRHRRCAGRRLRRRSQGVEIEAFTQADAATCTINARPDLRRTPSIATIWSGPRRHAAEPRAVPAAGPTHLERAEDGRPGRWPGPRRSATRGLSGLFYVDGRTSSSYNTGSDLFPQKDAEAASRSSTAASASAGPTIAGRSSCGRRICSTRTIAGRVQLAVPGRAVEHRRAAGFTGAFVDPQYPGDASSSRVPRPSRGPSA